MQYVRSISGSVSSTWNSINPATLSGAIDVIVVEHEDGTLACSPFHVRFGKFSLLRPHEKKVDFRVNGVRQEIPLKLAEGGEAFFVFKTANTVPEALQTSPLISPVASPEFRPQNPSLPVSDLEPLDLTADPSSTQKKDENDSQRGLTIPNASRRSQSEAGGLSSSLGEQTIHPSSSSASTSKRLGNRMRNPPSIQRHNTDHALPASKVTLDQSFSSSDAHNKPIERPVASLEPQSVRAESPALQTNEDAMTRAINLSKKLWGSNIPSQVTEKGDLMLDMTGYKSSDDEALRAEVIARKILSEETEGSYDIGSLIGADEKGNLWIYSSEEAKEQANRKLAGDMHDLQPLAYTSSDALSDPGYHSDDTRSEPDVDVTTSHRHMRHDSDSAVGMSSPPYSPDHPTASDPTRNYAKTLRLTSEQLKTLQLKPGQNSMSFTVNRATCTASLWLWRYDVPIVISDIDGTITKSDALGHILNMIGRDWTHLGVAKLYTDISANGYNIMYLTSRSIGQADTTRTYLSGVVQEGGYKLPRGPVILSPDRTIAALRREIYLRKPEIFKMACLRDIMALFHGQGSIGPAAGTLDPHAPNKPTGQQRRAEESNARPTPFYAGFGNRLTDALSYRSVNIPSTRIFTINSSAEVSLDLLSLNTYKTGYSSMREIVDHFFPPVGLLVKGGGEEYTDFNYWRDKPLNIADFSASESGESDDEVRRRDEDDAAAEDEGEDDEEDEEDEFGRRVRNTTGRPSEDEAGMGDSFVSFADDGRARRSLEQSILDSLKDEDFDDEDDDEDEDEEVGEVEESYYDNNDEDDEQVAGSLELDEQQRDYQDELRADLKDLARALSSPRRQQQVVVEARKDAALEDPR